MFIKVQKESGETENRQGNFPSRLLKVKHKLLQNKFSQAIFQRGMTVFCCVCIIVFGITLLSKADPITTSIGQDISTNNLSLSGSVTSGTWAGSSIDVAHGGTGQNWSAIIQGSLPFFSGTGALSTLTPGTAGQFLQSGGVGANPSWASIPSDTSDNLVYDFFNRDDTSTGNIGISDSGYQWVLRGAGGADTATQTNISSHKWVSQPGDIAYALYHSPKKVARMGATISYISNTGSNEPAFGMALSPVGDDTLIYTLLHFAVNRTHWELTWRLDNGSFNPIASYTFPTPFPDDGTAYQVQIQIVGDTAWITVGPWTRKVVNPNILAYGDGRWIYWEPYCPSSDASSLLRIHGIWMSDSSQALPFEASSPEYNLNGLVTNNINPSAQNLMIGSSASSSYPLAVTGDSQFIGSINIPPSAGAVGSSGLITHLSASNEMYIRGGTSGLNLNDNALADVKVFANSAEGLTKKLNISGYRTGDAPRSLQIGVGADAANTASFSGLDNYYFSGKIGVGTATPATTAQLDVSSVTKGFLPPRMTTAQRDAISAPAEGLMIYNLTTHEVNFYNGTVWKQMTSS